MAERGFGTTSLRSRRPGSGDVSFLTACSRVEDRSSLPDCIKLYLSEDQRWSDKIFARDVQAAASACAAMAGEGSGAPGTGARTASPAAIAAASEHAAAAMAAAGLSQDMKRPVAAGPVGAGRAGAGPSRWTGRERRPPRERRHSGPALARAGPDARRKMRRRAPQRGAGALGHSAAPGRTRVHRRRMSRPSRAATLIARRGTSHIRGAAHPRA